MAQRPRNGIALASIDLEAGQYTRYEEYRSDILDKLLPLEKINDVELYGGDWFSTARDRLLPPGLD